MTEKPSWDPSLVDPTNREFDGLILRSVGGRTGPVTLENGQQVRFPFRAQQEVAGSTPPNIGAEHQAAGSTMRLVIQGGAAFNGTPEISMIAPLPGSLVPPSITLIDDLLSTPNANSIVLGGTAGGVQIDGQSLTINSAGGLSLASDDSITLSTSGAGDDLILDPTGALTATGSSISLVSDGNGNVTITASGTGDLLLTGSPVSVNGTDISTPLGVWSAFTPTLSGTGTALGNGSLTGFYMKLGKLLFLRVRFTLGTTSTIGSTVSFALPTGMTAVTETDQFQMFPGMLRDTGTAEFLGMFRAASGSTTITAYALGAGGTYTSVNAVSSTVPHVWANTDVLSFVGAIEVA